MFISALVAAISFPLFFISYVRAVLAKEGTIAHTSHVRSLAISGAGVIASFIIAVMSVYGLAP